MSSNNQESAVMPSAKIVLQGKKFCLAGKFKQHGRFTLREAIEKSGGLTVGNIDATTDYYVQGSQGLRCCSFRCCQRVHDKALSLKSAGIHTQFISEEELLAALFG